MFARVTRTARPPGPRGLPLIGEARNFARDPLAFLTGVADVYGDIANFRLGGLDVFFVRHPDYVREVLITQRASFTMTALRARINAVVGEGLFTSRGELHARQQRLMLPVFRKSRIAAYAVQMAELSRRARDQWQAGSTIDIADEMMKLTMLIAAQALFEQDIGSDTQAVSRNIGAVLEFFPACRRRSSRSPSPCHCHRRCASKGRCAISMWSSTA